MNITPLKFPLFTCSADNLKILQQAHSTQLQHTGYFLCIRVAIVMGVDYVMTEVPLIRILENIIHPYESLSQWLYDHNPRRLLAHYEQLDPLFYQQSCRDMWIDALVKFNTSREN